MTRNTPPSSSTTVSQHDVDFTESLTDKQVLATEKYEAVAEGRTIEPRDRYRIYHLYIDKCI